MNRIKLSEGVFASDEGLEVEGEVVPWEHAAEQLRYHEGRPWAFVTDETLIQCVSSNTTIPPNSPIIMEALDRGACMICDSEVEFRALRRFVNAHIQV